MKDKDPVAPETIYSMIAMLRETVDETLALAASLTHPPSVADLMATAKALRRDIAALERLLERGGSKRRRGHNREPGSNPT